MLTGQFFGVEIQKNVLDTLIIESQTTTGRVAYS